MPGSDQAAQKLSPGTALAHELVDRIEELILNAERAGQPLEVEPQRSRLFELFVMADASGFLDEGAECDLTCDGIGRDLSGRWDLARSVGSGLSQPSSLPTAQLAKLRLLWSFMRMWMEWTYAWKRWDEFHPSARPGDAG